MSFDGPGLKHSKITRILFVLLMGFCHSKLVLLKCSGNARIQHQRVRSKATFFKLCGRVLLSRKQLKGSYRTEDVPFCLSTLHLMFCITHILKSKTKCLMQLFQMDLAYDLCHWLYRYGNYTVKQPDCLQIFTLHCLIELYLNS